MEDLKKLLDRIKHSLDSDTELREAVAEVIKEVCGFNLRLEDISIKAGRLKIDTTPPKKSEIKLHEKLILKKLEKTKLKIKRIY